MSRPCSVCIREDHLAIDARIRGGVSFRVLAREVGVSKSTLNRHAKHLAAAPRPPFSSKLTEGQRQMSRLSFTPTGRSVVRWRKGGATPEPRQEEQYDPLRW